MRKIDNMPTGSYSVSFSLPAGNMTSGRQPETEYNNDALDGAMSSLRVLGRCLGSGGPRSTRKLCGRRLRRTHCAIWGRQFDFAKNYQIEQVAQTRLLPISYREKTRVKMKRMEFWSRGMSRDVAGSWWWLSFKWFSVIRNCTEVSMIRWFCKRLGFREIIGGKERE